MLTKLSVSSEENPNTLLQIAIKAKVTIWNSSYNVDEMILTFAIMVSRSIEDPPTTTLQGC